MINGQPVDLYASALWSGMERERERQRETETERETQRQRERDTERDECGWCVFNIMEWWGVGGGGTKYCTVCYHRNLN